MFVIFKCKEDVQSCENYRGVILMSLIMKNWKKIIDKRVQNRTIVTRYHYGFIPRRSTMERISCV